MSLMQNGMVQAVALIITITIVIVVLVRRLPQSRLKYQQRLEWAAGGEMSETVRRTFAARAQARFVCSLIGGAVGTIVLALCLALGVDVVLGLMLFLAGTPLGLGVGSVIGAFRVIGSYSQTRIASLKPRELTDYLPRSSIVLQWLLLLLPVLAIVVAATSLAQGTQYRAAVVALIVSSVVALAAGLVAPVLRRRLLEIPNRAEDHEQRFWNSAWLSLAIGDLTAAAMIAALVLAGLPATLGVVDLLDTYWMPIGLVTVACTAVGSIASVADPALSSGGGGEKAIPWYLRQNPPRRLGRPAGPQAGAA